MINYNSLILQPPLYPRKLNIHPLKYFNLFVGDFDKGRVNLLDAIQTNCQEQGKTAALVSADLPEPQELVCRFEKLPAFEQEEILVVLKLLDLSTTHLPEAGSGTLRVLQILTGLIESKSQIFLINAVDRSLHYSVVQEFIPFLCKLAHKHNQQIFATSYNFDCWLSFLSLKEDIFTVHRVESRRDTTFAFNRDEIIVVAECNLRID